MSHTNMDHTINAASGGEHWQSLYRIGAVAALISVAIIVVSIIAFFIWPTFPDDILIVIEQDKLPGLTGLDFMYLLGCAFGLPFFLVLYVTLREIDPGWALVALGMGLVGLVTNVAVFGLYVPEVGIYISLLSVVGYLIWYVQVARRLMPLGWGGSTREAAT